MTESIPKVERTYPSIDEALSAAIEARVQPIEYKATFNGKQDTWWSTAETPEEFLDELAARGFDSECKDSITLLLPVGHDTLSS